MHIPRTTYAGAARRLMLLTPLVFPGFSAVGIVLAVVVGLPSAMILRNLVGGDLGMALAIVSMLPFLVLPILLPVAVMVLIDRRIGIRCPKCNVSLTMRCMHDKVLIARRCFHCKATVLLDDEFDTTHGNSRRWLIAILLAIGVLGIVVAVVLPIVAPRPQPADPNTVLIESGALLGVIFLITLIQTAINNVLKRLWRREAKPDQAGDHLE